LHFCKRRYIISEESLEYYEQERKPTSRGGIESQVVGTHQRLKVGGGTQEVASAAVAERTDILGKTIRARTVVVGPELTRPFGTSVVVEKFAKNGELIGRRLEDKADTADPEKAARAAVGLKGNIKHWVANH